MASPGQPLVGLLKLVALTLPTSPLAWLRRLLAWSTLLVWLPASPARPTPVPA
jgi:hypothetical protein